MGRVENWNKKITEPLLKPMPWGLPAGSFLPEAHGAWRAVAADPFAARRAGRRRSRAREVRRGRTGALRKRAVDVGKGFSKGRPNFHALESQFPQCAATPCI